MWAKWGQSKTKCLSSPNPGPAQSAAAEMPGDGRFSKPTLFHRQGIRPHAELHQQPYPGNGHWKLKVRHSFQLTGTQKPCKVCAEFCPSGGSCSWGHMQTIPNPAELTLHVRLKPRMQSAQVSWLGLCGPETSPWSAGTSLLASIECHADDRRMLFHPFSLVGCQG